MLCLHGLGASWEWWTPTLQSLSPALTVCAIDLPGHGDSTPLEETPGDEVYRELVAEVTRQLDLAPVILVGHSMGGYVAAQAAIQATPGVIGAVLVDAAGFGPITHLLFQLLSMPILGAFGELASRSHALLIRLFLRTLVYDGRSVSPAMIRWSRETIRHPIKRQLFLYQLRMLLRLGQTSGRFLLRDFEPPQVPMLLVWGKHDPVFHPHLAYRAQSLLGCKAPVIFEKSGHFPQLEEMSLFNSVLMRFVVECNEE